MKSVLFHVLVPFLFCIALANTSLFDSVQVEMSYDHYAEKVVDYLPALLAMPFNSLINLGYIVMGLHWLFGQDVSKETKESRYVREVFALMALFYAPVQWARLTTMRRPPAVLDQWFTLPIFAWVPVWCNFIESAAEWRRYAVTVQLCSVLSYGLAVVHVHGFDVALGLHVAFAVYKGARVQLVYGDHRSQRHLLLAMMACAGFVVLKLLDHWLAEYSIFQHLTGHFWSKVCDVLQFHFSFCFLTHLTRRAQGLPKAK